MRCKELAEYKERETKILEELDMRREELAEYKERETKRARTEEPVVTGDSPDAEPVGEEEEKDRKQAAIESNPSASTSPDNSPEAPNPLPAAATIENAQIMEGGETSVGYSAAATSVARMPSNSEAEGGETSADNSEADAVALALQRSKSEDYEAIQLAMAHSLVGSDNEESVSIQQQTLSVAIQQQTQAWASAVQPPGDGSAQDPLLLEEDDIQQRDLELQMQQAIAQSLRN